MKYLLLALCLCTMGCIHAPARGSLSVSPGVPGPTQAQIDSCEKTRTWHNVWVMTGAIFGGIGGAGGGATAATSNKDAQTGIAIGAAGAGVLAVISTTAAGIEADTYSEHNCQTILSQAPVTP